MCGATRLNMKTVRWRPNVLATCQKNLVEHAELQDVDVVFIERIQPKPARSTTFHGSLTKIEVVEQLLDTKYVEKVMVRPEGYVNIERTVDVRAK